MVDYFEGVWEKLIAIQFPGKPVPTSQISLTINLGGMSTANQGQSNTWFISAQNLNTPHDIINGSSAVFTMPSGSEPGNPGLPAHKAFNLTVSMNIPGGYAIRLCEGSIMQQLPLEAGLESLGSVNAMVGSPPISLSRLDNNILNPADAHGTVGTATATQTFNPPKGQKAPPPITITKVKAPGAVYTSGDFSNYLMSADTAKGSVILKAKVATFDIALDFSGTKTIGIAAAAYRLTPWGPEITS